MRWAKPAFPGFPPLPAQVPRLFLKYLRLDTLEPPQFAAYNDVDEKPSKHFQLFVELFSSARGASNHSLSTLVMSLVLVDAHPPPKRKE